MDAKLLTKDAMEVIKDPQIDIIVELIGGTGVAKTLCLEAVDNGKHLVTANKALLAEHGLEIYRAAAEKRVDLGFEASVCGAIPIIRSVKEGLVANRILSIMGIVNGTTNYILTKMTESSQAFASVLAEAQAKGYAEADPTLDVGGGDAAHKLQILASLAYGGYIRFSDIYIEGIQKIEAVDIAFARELGYRIKLLAIAKEEQGELEVRVHPTMIPETHLLASVGGVYNAVHIRGDSCRLADVLGTRRRTDADGLVGGGRHRGDRPQHRLPPALPRLAASDRGGGIRDHAAADGADHQRLLPSRDGDGQARACSPRCPASWGSTTSASPP